MDPDSTTHIMISKSALPRFAVGDRVTVSELDAAGRVDPDMEWSGRVVAVDRCWYTIAPLDGTEPAEVHTKRLRLAEDPRVD